MKSILLSLLLFAILLCFGQNKLARRTADTLITYYSDSTQACNKSKVYLFVEQEPTFGKGLPALEQMLNKNLALPKTAKGLVEIWFVVNCNGLAYGFQTLNKVEGVDIQAMQNLLAENQFWHMGKQNGVTVDCCYLLRIKIKKGKLKILNTI